MRLALAALMIGMLLTPASAGAEDGEITFPEGGSGAWQGVLFFAGYFTSDTVRSDGSFNTTVTDVIGDTQILVDLVVGDDGQIVTGTMSVDLTWFDEGVGTNPVTFTPYRVVHDQHQTGTLRITGNANRMVAAGTLTHTVNTSADGGTISEVSGSETRQVEWVFHAVEANCARVRAELIETSGLSLMASTLIARTTIGDGHEIHNNLQAELLLTPADLDDPETIQEALEAVAVAADGVHKRTYPEASNLLELVDAWDHLNALLAGLDECQAVITGQPPESNRSWLVAILQEGLNKALENPDFYEASDFIDLWVAGLQEGALNPDLILGFLDTFHTKLDEAISNSDNDTIYDILSFAAAYGWPVLYEDAKAALQ